MERLLTMGGNDWRAINLQKKGNLLLLTTTKDVGQMSLKYSNPHELTIVIEKRQIVFNLLKKIYPNHIGLPVILNPPHGKDIYIADESYSGRGWTEYETAIETDALVFIEKPRFPIPIGVLAADCGVLVYSTNFLSGYGLLHISRVNYKTLINNWLLFLRGLYLAKFYKKSNPLLSPLKIYGLVAPYGVYPYTQNSKTIIINIRELIETEIRNFVAKEKDILIEYDIEFSSHITSVEDSLFPSHHLQVTQNLSPLRMLVLGVGY